jgi:glucose-1-phosphate thymidylyltransferase
LTLPRFDAHITAQVKGILLAGGSGTRLYPMTAVVSKQLLPIYDKPLIHYPLATLMLGGVREILVISTPGDLPRFEELLRDGNQWGIKISYAEQPRPEGIAQALLIGASHIGPDGVVLVLGDNIFHGYGLGRQIADRIRENHGATVFTYEVRDPQRYGVAELNAAGDIISIEEKPSQPKSNWAVTGLYLYDAAVLSIARNLKPSPRGELEITDVNRAYLARGKLRACKLSRGSAWLDTGTPEALLEAATFISVIERRQGLKINCVEEIAYRQGYIDAAQLDKLARGYGNSDYGRYLRGVLTS